MQVFDSYEQTLFSCPMVALTEYAKRHNAENVPIAYFNFGGITGSYNDVLAIGIISIAEEKGALAKGQPIVEVSCGSFATALAAACVTSGHTLHLVVPMGLPPERYMYLESFGVHLIMSSTSRSEQHRAAEKVVEREGAYFVNYFDNDYNTEFHRRITGPSILEAMDSDIDAIVVGVGSGGTVSGVGEYIKGYLPDVKIVAVEPYESQAIGGGIIGRHTIHGLGAGFVPENYNAHIVDKVVAVTSASARETANELLHKDGIPCDVASGAVICAAIELAKANAQLKKIVCVCGGRSIS
ncbi:MAG: pyridoxal-phosphate dependent enzyme [Oscillospiraceae bacterium]